MARAHAIRLAHALWARLLASAAWSLLATVSVKARSTHSKPSFAACASGSPGHRHNATVTGFHSASLRCNVGTTSQSSRPLTRRLISGVRPCKMISKILARHQRGVRMRFGCSQWAMRVGIAAQSCLAVISSCGVGRLRASPLASAAWSRSSISASSQRLSFQVFIAASQRLPGQSLATTCYVISLPKFIAVGITSALTNQSSRRRKRRGLTRVRCQWHSFVV